MAAHRYWRVYINQTHGGSGYVIRAMEIQFRETSGGANVATGGTAIGISATPANAFDGNTATDWTSASQAPGWIGYDFGAGVTREITEWVWVASSVPAYGPSSAQLEWSDDGTTWYVAYPSLNIPAWSANETKTFTQPNTSITTVTPSSPGPFLFIGGELEDFIMSSQTPQIYLTATGGWYRSGYARGGVLLTGPNGTYSVWANFTPSTTFGVTYRSNLGTTSASFAVTTPIVTLGSGANVRLRLRRTSTADPSTLTLEKFDGTTATSLGVSTATVASGVTQRFDILVDSYGASGRVRVYVNQALLIDSGTANIAAGGTTALDRLTFHPNSNSTSFSTSYSEVIVAQEDTRSLSLVTLVPNAVGDANGFIRGGWAEIDDVTASESDVAAGDTAGQLLSVNTTGLPTTTLIPRAVKVIAGAARGSTGPSRLGLGVRSGGINVLDTAALLETGYGITAATWAVNPVTGAAWTVAELEALQLAFRAET